MTKFAAIFPGQGAQLVGMGQDVAAEHEAAARVFAEADDVLGFGLTKLCHEGPDDKLNATDIQQPAIFTTSVALFRAAEEAGLLPSAFAAMGGLSLGEYTALHLAGALSFADALKLVQKRGALMQQAAEQSEGGMVSIMGLEEPQVCELCEAVAGHGRIAPANFNCPGQIVVSGDKAACEAVLPRIEAAGGKAVPLKVAGAFHSPLMQPAADELKAALAAAAWQAPTVPVIANVTADYHGEPVAIQQSLYEQVTQPVRWQMCVERLIADGCEQFYEVGPNRVLMGLMRKINRQAKTTNISSIKNFTSTD